MYLINQQPNTSLRIDLNKILKLLNPKNLLSRFNYTTHLTHTRHTKHNTQNGCIIFPMLIIIKSSLTLFLDLDSYLLFPLPYGLYSLNCLKTHVHSMYVALYIIHVLITLKSQFQQSPKIIIKKKKV